MNFAVFKDNKRTVRSTFSTYEKARQYVRKLIRKKQVRESDFNWTSNPMIGNYGYKIRQVG
jgi:hypothetical protein